MFIMNNMIDRCNDLVGHSVWIRERDWGIVTEWYSVSNDGHTSYVAVTDKDLKFEIGSYFHYLRVNGLTYDGFDFDSSELVYPDGSDYAARLRLPKTLTNNINYVPACSISNTAHSSYSGTNKWGGV